MGGNKKRTDVNATVYIGQGKPPLSESVLLLVQENLVTAMLMFIIERKRELLCYKFLYPSCHEIYPQTIEKYGGHCANELFSEFLILNCSTLKETLTSVSIYVCEGTDSAKQ